MQGSILVVEDDQDAAVIMAATLRKQGWECTTCGGVEQALLLMAQQAFDLVLTDVHLGAQTGIELCRRIRDAHPDTLVIVITGQGTIDVAIEAIRAGAYDFELKPISAEALAVSVRRGLEHQSLRREVTRLRERVGAASIHSIVGESPAVRELTDLITRVATSDATVLIIGESGTGKELVAREIHDHGPRADQPFVAINCAAMPASLLESELFGHVKGAFTDARRDRPGLILQAGKGTLFLDEIGEMPLEMQAKLLRVLQERKVRPVGGDEEVEYEARLVTATNRDLETEVEEKRFREDLYYRINVVHVPVPPLRARQGDILLLAQHFISRIAKRTDKPVEGLTAEAAQKLLDYDWPGNVRELENCIERAMALTRTCQLAVEDIPEKIRHHVSSRLVIETDDPTSLITLEEMERRYVRRVIEACGGNKSQAARVLGIDRRSLYRRLDDKTPEPAAS